MSNQEKHFYEFGPFHLDPVKRRLRRAGEPVPLTPKAFDTLLALVEQGGKTVEKDELMRVVWPDAVVEENNLNQNIAALRRSLGDSRQESRYIATIPGLGYRFVAEVRRGPLAEAGLTADAHVQPLLLVENGLEPGADTQVEEADLRATGAAPASAAAAAAQAIESSESCLPEACCTASPDPLAAVAQKVAASEGVQASSAPASRAGESVITTLKHHRKVAALIVALLLLAAAGITSWVYRLVGPQPTPTAPNEIEVTPLTRTGTTGGAAISPDGRYVVYSVHEAGRESLWLRQVAASSARPVVPPAEVAYMGLTFSRDGNHLYFVRAEMQGSVRALYRMPALGGVPTRLLAGAHSPITLSPDGSRLAFVRDSRDESALIIANADGSDERKLAAHPLADYFKIPAWSPDGKVIACSFGSGEPYDIQNSVIAVRVDDGTQSPLTPQRWAGTHWVEWLADGSGLLITARERHETPDQIWHIAYPGGAARRITSDSKMYRSISLTADSRTLAAVQTELNSEIWVAPEADSARARKITSGTGYYGDACYAPDGRIVYASQASGSWDIWVMNADGSGPKQLTADAGVNLHQVVSSDGRHIVFASNRAGVFNIWRIDSDGGNPVQLTRGRGEKFPHCSPDGKWVVYLSVSPGEGVYSIWKVAIDGGEPEKLTDRDSGSPVVSPDGTRIAYFYDESAGGDEFRVAVMPFAGGPPERTLILPRESVPLRFVRWAPDGRALTYVAHRDGISNVWRQPLDGGPAKQVTDFKVEGSFLFNWSPDGKQLVLTRRLWPSDLLLLKNFAPRKT